MLPLQSALSLGLLVWSIMQWPMQLGGGRGRRLDAEINAPPVMETHFVQTTLTSKTPMGLQGLTLSQLDPKINTSAILW